MLIRKRSNLDRVPASLKAMTEFARRLELRHGLEDLSVQVERDTSALESLDQLAIAVQLPPLIQKNPAVLLHPCFEGMASPVQSYLGSANGDAQYLSDLGNAQFFQLAQVDDGAVIHRQLFDEPLDATAHLVLEGCVPVIGRGVLLRLIELADKMQTLAENLVRRALQSVQGRVGGNLENPGREAALLPERGQVLVDLQEDFLNKILSLGGSHEAA